MSRFTWVAVDMSRLANTIEAILYLKAQPLKIAQIAEFAKCDKDSAEEGLIELMGEYSHREGALEIAETEEGYALQLRELYKPLVDSIVPLDIGLGALRTLAAIALRSPIAQSELVELRGSGVYQHVPDLVEQGFVKKRRQSDGRSSWLQITEKFYQHFEIDKLPQISNLRLPKPIESGQAESEQAEGQAASAEGSQASNETTAPATAEAPETETVETETSSAHQPPGDQGKTPAAATEETEETTIGSTDTSSEKEAIAPSPTSNRAEEDITEKDITEEIAVLSGLKAPSSANAVLSDAAIEAAADRVLEEPDSTEAS
ncbi:MAG: SMC-Scp complex subunit ScpB [Cyanobacteria bacterium J06634_5]